MTKMRSRIGARADRGDDRDALGGGRDLRLRLRVERLQQRALGDVDEVAPVDDVGHRARRLPREPCAVCGPLRVERDRAAPLRAAPPGRRRRPRALASAACRSAMRRWRISAAASRAAKTTSPSANSARKASPSQPSEPARREQLLDQRRRSTGRTPARRGRRGRSSSKARRARPPARAENQRPARLRSRARSRRARRRPARSKSGLGADDRFGRRRGLVVDRDAPSSRRNARGRGRAPSCEPVSDQELQRAVEPDVRRRLVRAPPSAGGI